MHNNFLAWTVGFTTAWGLASIMAVYVTPSAFAVGVCVAIPATLWGICALARFNPLNPTMRE